MNEGEFQQHRDESLSRARSLAITLGFYAVALVMGVVFAIYSQESGIRLYLILLLGSIMGAVAEYFISVAIYFGVHFIRHHSANTSADDNSRNA